MLATTATVATRAALVRYRSDFLHLRCLLMMLSLVVLVSVVRVLLLLLLTLTEVGLLPFGGLVIVLTEQFLTMFVPVLMLLVIS